MITHIRMKNFKSWQESPEVKLAPLTGFFGTNSSGKSSLLQMLLLLKQTAERSDPEEVIFFGDEHSLVNLGSFREVIHGHKEDKLLKLEFGCKFPEHFIVEIYGRKHLDSFKTFYFPVSIDHFTFNTLFEQNEGKLQIVNLGYHFESSHVPKVNRDISENLRKVEKNLSKIIHVNWRDGCIIYIDSFNQKHRFKQEVKNFYGVPSLEDKSLRQLSSAFEALFGHVFFSDQLACILNVAFAGQGHIRIT